MELFNNLKGLLHAKNLLNASGETATGSGDINYDAGADILTHFQKDWEDLHKNNEENAQKAEKLAEIIAEVHTATSTRSVNINKINQILTATPNLSDSIANSAKEIAELQNAFENVERALVNFEELIDRCEFEQMKNNHRYQLALYKEKKLGNLEVVRTELANKHAQTVIDFEFKQKLVSEERQQVFQEAFKSDLETYKSLGSIPKIVPKVQSSALLEEIQLDIDDKELNDFLSEK